MRFLVDTLSESMDRLMGWADPIPWFQGLCRIVLVQKRDGALDSLAKLTLFSEGRQAKFASK